MPPALATVLLLVASNAFMAYAWYGLLHDGRRDGARWLAIASSWLIALPEYCLALPANRLGRAMSSTVACATLSSARHGVSRDAIAAITGGTPVPRKHGARHARETQDRNLTQGHGWLARDRSEVTIPRDARRAKRRVCTLPMELDVGHCQTATNWRT